MSELDDIVGLRWRTSEAIATLEELEQQYREHRKLGEELRAVHNALLSRQLLGDWPPPPLDMKVLEESYEEIHAWYQQYLTLRAAVLQARAQAQAL
jgi:hypothetical protein